MQLLDISAYLGSPQTHNRKTTQALKSTIERDLHVSYQLLDIHKAN